MFFQTLRGFAQGRAQVDCVFELDISIDIIQARASARGRHDDEYVTGRYTEYIKRRNEFRPVFQTSYPEIPYILIDVSHKNPTEIFKFILEELAKINPEWATPVMPSEEVQRRLDLYRSLVGPDGMRDFRPKKNFDEAGAIDTARVRQAIYQMSDARGGQARGQRAQARGKDLRVGDFPGTMLCGLDPSTLSRLNHTYVFARKVCLCCE